MENACCECCVCMTFNEYIAEMLTLSSSATCYDRYRKHVGKTRKCFIGISFLNSIVVHTCEQYLTGTSFLSLVCPLKQIVFGALSSAFGVA